MADLVPQLAADAVLVKSEAMPDDCGETVKGYDFNNGVNYHELLKSYGRSGFQATNFGKAVEEINKMVSYWSDVYTEINTVVSNIVNSDHVCLFRVMTSEMLGKLRTCTSGVYAITVTTSTYHSRRCGRL